MLGQGGVSPVPGGAQGHIPQWNGIYYGIVSNNADPKNQNRALLRIPQILGSAVTTWAVSLTPQQSKPKVGAMVAALFIGGDLDYPAYYIVNPKIQVESVSGNIQPVGTTVAAGTSSNLAAADHVHTLANALESTGSNIKPVAASPSAGTSAKASRADHAHAGLPAGSGGFLEIDSSTAFGGDVQAYIQLESQGYAGRTTINLGASAVQIGGYAISSQATPSIGTVNHNPNDPSYGGAGGSSWLSGERAALDSQVDQINANFSAITAALQAAGIWH